MGVTQAEIDRLSGQGVNIIILATQLQSIRNDLALVPQLRGVDVVVSGGGDEVLGDATDLYVPGDERNIFGAYPQWATGADGVLVPIVTTSGDYKYVGLLQAGFDANGRLTGVDEAASKMVRVAGGAQPDAVQPDPTIQQMVVDPVAAYVAGLAQTVIGQSEVALEGRRPQIRNQETNLGNLMVDSLLWSARQQAASFGAPAPDVALQNGGGIRNNSLLPAGNVTELTTFDVAPFLNFTAIVPGVTPQDLKNLLENAYARIANADGRFAHVAGLRVVVDTSKPGMVIDVNGNITTPGERVRSVILADGTVMVAEGQIAATAKNVNVATIDFLARGGDQYPFPKPYTFIRLGATYQQALRDYIVSGLGGAITAAQYPEGGAGRIVIDPAADLQLTVLHNNDAESRLLNAGAGALADYGGIARFATLMKNLEQAAVASSAAVSTTVLKVEAGDNFLAGAEWNASLDHGLPYYDAVGQDYLNYDVISLGNHDFDFGPDITANFINSFQPGPEVFLAANADFSQEAVMQAFVNDGRLAKSVIVEKAGRKIGVIGLMPPESAFITSLRDITILPDTAAVVQTEIDALHAAGAKIIVLATQLQTILNDITLARQLHGLDVVVSGGGDDTLGSPTDLYVPGDETNIRGPYPWWAPQEDGSLVPIVSTSGDYRYVGQLVAQFDANGRVLVVDDAASRMVRVAGGALPDAVPPDPFVQQNVTDPVAAYTAGLAQTVVGVSEVGLEGRRPQIRNQETNLGNLFADAILWQAQQQAAQFGAPMPEVALQNGGGIRNNSLIPAGNITELNTFQIAAFLNFVSIVEAMTPQQLKDTLENGYARVEIADGRFAHIAGMKVEVDLTRQGLVIDVNGNVTTPGERVRKVVLDDGTVIIEDGQIAATARNVNLATIDFLVAQRGDQYIFWPATWYRLGATYQQALRDFIKTGLNGQITAAEYPEGGEGRIKYLP